MIIEVGNSSHTFSCGEFVHIVEGPEVEAIVRAHYERKFPLATINQCAFGNGVEIKVSGEHPVPAIP